MVTKEEYAKLSMEVYDGSIPVGWELIDESDPTLTSGLFAQALRKTGTNEVQVKGLFTRNQPFTQRAAEQLVTDLETLKSQPQVAQNTAILADLVNAQDKVKQSVQDILSVELGNSQWSEADGANLLDITINLQHTLAQESQVIRVELPDAAFDKFASSPGGCITTAQSVAL